MFTTIVFFLTCCTLSTLRVDYLSKRSADRSGNSFMHPAPRTPHPAALVVNSQSSDLALSALGPLQIVAAPPMHSAIYYSLFIIHYSLFIIHYSLFIIHLFSVSIAGFAYLIISCAISCPKVFHHEIFHAIACYCMLLCKALHSAANIGQTYHIGSVCKVKLGSHGISMIHIFVYTIRLVSQHVLLHITFSI